jgi:molybdenum cofactor cytidylyltransferase
MIAAVILAAGSSTRMRLNAATGDVPSKPLLPLGSTTVVERVVRSVREAGIRQIVVVTGYAADRLAPVLDGLGVTRAHNADHLDGMFSSIRTGIWALRPDVDAFFILPVDYALVQPEVLIKMLRRHAEAGGATRSDAGSGVDSRTILHPTCCRRRGHPPLIPARYREELLTMGGGGNLRTFTENHVDDEVQVEVEDLTILMDMDTPKDYQRMARLARNIDSPVDTGLSPGDSRFVRSLLEPSDQLIAHAETVAILGLALGRAVRTRAHRIDLDLLYSACLLHDLAKGQPKHSAIGQRLLEGLGLPRLAEIVGAHMVLPSEQLDLPHLTEDQIVYLADKLVIGDHVVGIAEKTAHTLGKHRGNPEGIESAKARMEAASVVAQRVEAFLGRSLEDVILEAKAGDSS